MELKVREGILRGKGASLDQYLDKERSEIARTRNEELSYVLEEIHPTSVRLVDSLHLPVETEHRSQPTAHDTNSRRILPHVFLLLDDFENLRTCETLVGFGSRPLSHLLPPTWESRFELQTFGSGRAVLPVADERGREGIEHLRGEREERGEVRGRENGGSEMGEENESVLLACSTDGGDFPEGEVTDRR